MTGALVRQPRQGGGHEGEYLGGNCGSLRREGGD